MVPRCDECGNEDVFEYCYTHIDITYDKSGAVVSMDGPEIAEIRCGKCSKAVKND